MPNETLPPRADVVVIGAGFVGIATALHIARLAPGRTVILLEREAAPGLHSSGKNAAMIRQVTSEETVSELARRGAEAIRRLCPEQSLLRPTGSLLVAREDKAAQLERDIAHARAAGLEVERIEPAVAKERFPALREADFEVA